MVINTIFYISYRLKENNVLYENDFFCCRQKKKHEKKKCFYFERLRTCDFFFNVMFYCVNQKLLYSVGFTKPALKF